MEKTKTIEINYKVGINAFVDPEGKLHLNIGGWTPGDGETVILSKEDFTELANDINYLFEAE